MKATLASPVELLFGEEKKEAPSSSETDPWDTKGAKDDFIKLAREMNDGYAYASAYFPNCHEPTLRTFGFQTVGFHVRVFTLNAPILRHYTVLKKLFEVEIPKCASSDIGRVLRLGCAMIQLKKMIQLTLPQLSKSQQDIHYERSHFNRILTHPVFTSTPTPKGGNEQPNRGKGVEQPGTPMSGGQPSSANISKLGEFPGSLYNFINKRVGHDFYVTWSTCPKTGQKVAVKWLRAHRCPKSFQQEISLHWLATSAKIPNVIPILTFLQPEGGHLVQLGAVFPFCQPLRDEKLISALSLAQVRNVICQIGEALRRLHQLSIVHFDVSTANIVLDPKSGEGLLIDFGHAEMVCPTFEICHNYGTPGYFAPEIKMGARGFLESDLFSLGVVLLHLLIPHLFSPSQAMNLLDDWHSGSSVSKLRRYVQKRAQEVVTDRGEAQPTGDLKDLQNLCVAALEMTQQDPIKRPYPQDLFICEGTQTPKAEQSKQRNDLTSNIFVEKDPMSKTDL